MGVNGVSHHVVGDDLEGVRTLLRLLAFCPPELGACGAPMHDSTFDSFGLKVVWYRGG